MRVCELAEPLRWTTEPVVVLIADSLQLASTRINSTSFTSFTTNRVHNMDPNSGDRRWGDYYMSGSQKPKEKYWALELVKHANQIVPSFNELFDEETFYLFAFFFVIGTCLTAFFLSKIVGVTIREYPLRVDRQWRDPKPAHFFSFPWRKKEATA